MTAIHRQVEQLRLGTDPTLVSRVGSGWVVLGGTQVVRGYCLLLPDPVVPSLNDLSRGARRTFLEEMGFLGDAILEVTGATRINYEMLGNLEPALHAHVIPRWNNEPEAVRTRPIWFHDWESAPRFDPTRDAALAVAIAMALRQLTA